MILYVPLSAQIIYTITMNKTSENHCRPNVFRHLVIMLYDILLLLSVLLLATLIAVAFNGGEAFGDRNPFFILYLFSVSGFFYCWFWTHGGQTLGMRAWKVHLIGQQQHDITWKQAITRFLVALISWLPLAMGYWWQWLGKDKQSWLDQFSNTRLHYDKKTKNKPLSPLS
jgi:uncharacterized RDD family membrane protein YckC